MKNTGADFSGLSGSVYLKNHLIFKQTVSDLERRQTFEQLISISNSPHPLTEKEVSAIEQEYVTLQMVIQSVIDQMSQSATMEEVMYKIYTEPSLYVNSKRVLSYLLRWLSKTFNEGTCESF